MHTYTAGNSIFDGPITSLLSVSSILKEIISRAHAKGGRSVSGFKFGTFVCRFPSDRSDKHGGERVNPLWGNSARLTLVRRTAFARAALPISASVCNIFVCPNNGMAANI